MSQACLINREIEFKFQRSIKIDQIETQDGEYGNKIQSCCYRHLLAVGTEKGFIYIFNFKKKKITKVLFGEQWISTLDNCNGVIWLSGISRSLFCIRIKDNKKIFHTNCDTDFDQYDGGGVKIHQEKVHRYFVYNSKYSRIRVLNPSKRKILLKGNMMKKIMGYNLQKEDSINQFCIDDTLGNVWFTYLHDENIYVYSYLLRRVIKVIKAYNPKLRDLNKDNVFRINLTLQPNYGYAVAHFSIVVAGEKPINVFSLYVCDRFKKGEESIKLVDKKICRNIKGNIFRMIFTQNFLEPRMIAVDSTGMMHVFWVVKGKIQQIQTIKPRGPSLSPIADIISPSGYLISLSYSGRIDIYLPESD